MGKGGVTKGLGLFGERSETNGIRLVWKKNSGIRLVWEGRGTMGSCLYVGEGKQLFASLYGEKENSEIKLAWVGKREQLK